MYLKCVMCSEAAGQLEVVLYSKDDPERAGFLLLDDKVVFDPDKVAKFATYCETNGVKLKKTQILDMCARCLQAARVQLN